MKATYEFSLENFHGWSGAQETIDKIVRADLNSNRNIIAEAEAFMEEYFGGEATETEINDFLRFEDEWFLGELGIPYEEADPDEVDEEGYEEEDV